MDFIVRFNCANPKCRDRQQVKMNEFMNQVGTVGSVTVTCKRCGKKQSVNTDVWVSSQQGANEEDPAAEQHPVLRYLGLLHEYEEEKGTLHGMYLTLKKGHEAIGKALDSPVAGCASEPFPDFPEFQLAVRRVQETAAAATEAWDLLSKEEQKDLRAVK